MYFDCNRNQKKAKATCPSICTLMITFAIAQYVILSLYYPFRHTLHFRPCIFRSLCYPVSELRTSRIILERMDKTMKSLQETLAEKVAKWLLRDIRLNANAASSGHYYEPDIPQEINKFKQNND